MKLDRLIITTHTKDLYLFEQEPIIKDILHFAKKKQNSKYLWKMTLGDPEAFVFKKSSYIEEADCTVCNKDECICQ